MKRREVVKGLVSAPAVWSTGAWAQPTERVRRVGVLVSARAGDAEEAVVAFREALELEAPEPVRRSLEKRLRQLEEDRAFKVH